MRRIQADVVLHDAEVFVPFIDRAFRNARQSSEKRFRHSPRTRPSPKQSAVSGAGMPTTPTGVEEGLRRTR